MIAKYIESIGSDSEKINLLIVLKEEDRVIGDIRYYNHEYHDSITMSILEHEFRKKQGIEIR
jgi:hypothetical protein